MIALIILAALLPVALLLFYIYRKDKVAPEPPKQLVKAFGFGVVSAFLSLAISIPLSYMGLYVEEPSTVGESIAVAFWGAAIPEEIAKLLMLWLLLRKNRFFDEKMDGIVYAVFVSLGFAAFENVLYLFDSDSWLGVGVSRALFAIPGHFCFAVLMGYYYSLAKFYPKSRTRNKVLALVAPILAHGIYDSLLFIMTVAPAVSGVLMIVFLFFCFKMWKYCSKNIKGHIDRDKQDAEYVPEPADTAEVELSEELQPLIEAMAKNVHEVWAKSRMDEGWTYGIQRDDIKKTHPCLLPYEELPETEKDYDKNTAVGTLKLIMKLGFKISR